MTSIVIAGFSSSLKNPGFYGETKYGAGPLTLGSIPLVLLLVGLKSSAGTMTADTDVLDVTTQDQANTYAGAGSELARMVAKALLYPGVKIKIASPGPASGSPTAAAATITIAGTLSVPGTWTYWIGGELISGNIAVGDTPTTIGAAIAAAVQSKPQLPFSAAADTGVVTLTCKTVGIRGNQYIIFQDTTVLPSGLTSTIAGGASVTGGGKLFASGTGSEDVTTLLSTLLPSRYDRVAFAQNDATNIGRWRAHSDAKADPTVGRMEHSHFASNGTLSAAATLATGANEERFCGPHMLNSESHPSEIAASKAALRCFTEQTNPNASYDGAELRGIVPQRARADWATFAVIQAALDEGVTELVTTTDGKVVVSRAITTHSLNGSDPDARTLDVADAVVPDYVRDYDRLSWETFRAANPNVAPDPGPTDKEPPAGVGTPKRWQQQLAVNGFALEDAKILTATASNPPYAEYDSVAKRIMAVHPAPRLGHAHQTGVSVLGLGAV